MNKLLTFSLFLIYLSFSTVVHAQNYYEVQKQTASQRESDSRFGSSMAASDQYVVVGALLSKTDISNSNPLTGAGAVYLFEKDANGHLVETQKIVASDRSENAQFGSSVAMSGNYMAVGSNKANFFGSDTIMEAGAVYLFELQGSTWVEVQRIAAIDTGAVERFGSSVALDGATLVVGVSLNDTDSAFANPQSNAGAAYIYERDGSGNWLFKKKIVASDRDKDDAFGSKVAIVNNKIVVTASYDEDGVSGGNRTNAGSAYIFTKQSNGSWIEQQKIVAPDRNSYDRFGVGLAMSDSCIVVGSHHQSYTTASSGYTYFAGAAYVYHINKSGKWQMDQKITASHRNENALFGINLYMDDDMLVAGATTETLDANEQNSLSKAGAAYVFIEDENKIWKQIDKLVNSDRYANDRFGSSSAIFDDKIIVGANLEDQDVSGGNTLSGAGSIYAFGMCTGYSTAERTINTCDTYVSPSGKYTWDTSGTYIDTIQNSIGCDSIITFNLTITNSSSNTIDIETCDEYTAPSGNSTWDVSGVYQDVIPNSIGCDSIITINLTILKSYSSITDSICSEDSYTSPSGKYTWNTEGEYTDTLQNSAGCDSIITINLSISDSLGCVTTISEQNTVKEICFYPNPANDFIYLKSHAEKVKMYNLCGKMEFEKHNLREMDVRLLPPGTYILELLQSNTISHHKVIIKH